MPLNKVDHGDITLTEDNGNASFEWLTNFASVMHLILPSRIVFGQLSSTHPFSQNYAAPKSSGDEEPLTQLLEKDSGSLNHDWRHHRQDPNQQCIRLNALHVGCGTSAVGESLLYLAESVSVCKGDSFSKCTSQHELQRYKLQYGHVANVDIDNSALERMQKRWRRLQVNHNDTCSRIDWRYLDFQNEESCRVALDPLYRTISSSSSQEIAGGYFDLVFDKSTLDCLLCSESEAVAGLLCEVYRALRIPSFKPFGIPNDRNLDHHAWLGWGGVYVLVTFHPLDFVRQLLTHLPGAEWTVEHEVVRREVEHVSVSCNIENCDHPNTEEIITRYDLSSNSIVSTGVRNYQVQRAISSDQGATKSAWSSGTFEPDESYRKNVNVFTCRRLPLEPTADSTNITLDRDKVRQHVEQCCNEWYKATNPMVTDEREQQITISFSRTTGGTEVSQSLELKQCYDVLFTELEQEHLPYEYFLEDWEAYCSNHDDVKVRDRMTLEVALDFLREMQ
ncbi:hypothetical protein ACHAWX_001133 [Stephanocyclus meneghinianus]